MRTKIFCGKALAIVSLVAVLSAEASVTPILYYKLGEHDGASAGMPGLGATEEVGGQTAYPIGPSFYSGDVGTPISSISMNLSSGGYYEALTALGSLSLTDNFGMEGWFKVPVLGGDRTLVRVGDATTGMGLSLTGNQLTAGMGMGFGMIGVPLTQVIPVNEWAYVALVLDQGALKLFVNSMTPTVNGFSALPVPAAPRITIGAAPDGNFTLLGLADEVRLFSFAPGQFNPNSDLLLAQVPEPATMALGILGIASFLVVRRRIG